MTDQQIFACIMVLLVICAFLDGGGYYRRGSRGR
jgi:hypothetical protein